METMEYARGRDWYIEATKPHGGFCFIHENSIHAVWGHLRSGDIALRDLRVWLACHELQARRCTLKRGRKPRFALDELHGLVGGVGGQHIRRSLRALEKLGLLRFRERELITMPFEVTDTPGRPVPVPRTVIRHLSKSRGRAYIATVLGHLIRCLYYKNGVCRSGGWCKASWIVDTFGVAVRAVKEARARLVELGLFQILNADQLRLNRFGRPLVVCLNWLCESAPRNTNSTTKSAPPEKHKKLSYRRVEHQEPVQTTASAGVCTKGSLPDLMNIREADLDDPWRLAALFKQARLSGWVRRTESEVLAVFSAAAHARRVGTRNHPGLFRWLIESRQWSLLSLEDEDRGRRLLRSLREHLGTRSPLRESDRSHATSPELCQATQSEHERYPRSPRYDSAPTYEPIHAR